MERHWRIVVDDYLEQVLDRGTREERDKALRHVLSTRFDAQSAAEREAEKLADTHKGCRFTVVEAVCSYIARPMRESPGDLIDVAREKLRGTES